MSQAISPGTTCRALRCGGCEAELRGENGGTLSVRACEDFLAVHKKCTHKTLKRVFTPEAELLVETGEWRWGDPSSIRSLVNVARSGDALR